ncbi:serine hydrolase domain-containing protein [Flavihumibacter profundi]|jgi:D-alanyl-D-alanine carboxypeptidase|uniref:serine hydrolase domain-containing protein n=1 Tax=Flavihumibacter profundi TaxID=2716883 RepID=UPI001CC391B1|nr:serine hydrolase domain-containing protein [Flavihumibacter profundi]MBZ5857088.1 beta-lactamase family protein [Flavihumibacter profundi]
MKKIYTLAIFAYLLLTACQKAQIAHTLDQSRDVPWADSSNNHPKNAAFRDLLEKYKTKGLPGISLLVNDKNGTWVGSTGYADIEKKIPFRVGQVAKIASITKLFMGTLVFKMIEDSVNTGIGYNSLYDPITKWLPSRITDKLPNGKLITLGQCMKHETGIPDVIDEDKFYLAVLNNPVKKWEQEELLEIIYGKAPVFAPGDTAIYSNTNTIIVSLILEAATGKKHEDLLKEYLLHPLALSQTFYQPYDQLPANTAQGYFDLYNNNTIVNVSNLVTGSGNGYGGLYSDVFDLYSFIDRLLIKKTILTQKSLTTMETYGKPDFPNQYGYGIMKKFIDRGEDAGVGHSGRDLGYSANLFYFQNKGVTHAFLVNYGTAGDSNLKKVFEEFQDELLDLTLKP